MEEAAEWEPLKWEKLRVVGKPLLSGAAFGATPLLWVACRAQPCLVHIFCDTQLQDIWRFPADPVFLLIGSGSRLEGEGERDECNARLLAITRDGCIWIVLLSKIATTANRLSKRQRTQNVGEIQRIKPFPVKATIAEAVSAVPPVQTQRRDPPGDATAKSSFLASWKELAVDTYTSAPRAIEVKNVLVADTLVGTIPGAKFAAFGPSDYVAVVSPIGYPELLYFNRLNASSNASHPESSEFRTSAPVFGKEPACLLIVSSMRYSQNHGPGETQAVVSQDLFESLSGPSAGASDHETLLIQGAMDGKVCTFHLQKGILVASSSYIICDLQQPIVTIIPAAYPLKRYSRMSSSQGCEEVRGANWLVVIGLLGQVAFLSFVRDEITVEELNDGPFLARRIHTPNGLERKYRHSSTLKELVSNEGVVRGPITSACLIGGARLCYTVGSAVFITELFDNFGSVVDGGEMGTGFEDLRSSSPSMPTSNSLMKLPSQRVPISNISAISGPGLFTYKGSHPLVALTGAGSLVSIKVSKQIASPVSAGNLGVDSYQNAPGDYSEKSVKVLLQSVSDAESCRDLIQSHEQALNLAMNELAVALPRARDIATDKKKPPLKTTFRNNHSTSKEKFATANVGLGCTLTASPVPSTSLVGDQLSFGGSGFGSLRTPSKFVDRNIYKSYKTRLDIALTNRCSSPLSQYWSFILELQSCLSTASPTLQYSFTINNGHGLPVGSQWNHRIHVNLPGGPWGPVMATVYLCHIHDSHKALLYNSRGSALERCGPNLGRASSAACIVLSRQQVDLLSLLQSPQSTLGHTSWTPALGGLRTSLSSLAGLGEFEMLDMTDSDMLGSFSGDLAWSFSFDAKHTDSRSIINGASDWQNAFLSHVLQQPSTSTEWKRLRLTSQGGEAVTISIDGRAGQGDEFHSLVNIQTSCLLLGVLFREALLGQIMDQESEAPSGKKHVVLHRNRSTNLMERWNEVEVLAQRGSEVLSLWKKILRLHAPTAEGLVAPLLRHTYEVTAQLIQVYKSSREESSGTLAYSC